MISRVSVPVELERLRAETDRYGRFPYVLTVSEDGRPHAVSVTVSWRGDALAAEVGARTAANAAGRPSVSLLWPPPERGGYSLIVDGTAEVDDGALRLTPTKAVLHRPALPGAEPEEGACGSDCVTILPGG
jgi:hypothetical protein